MTQDWVQLVEARVGIEKLFIIALFWIPVFEFLISCKLLVVVADAPRWPLKDILEAVPSNGDDPQGVEGLVQGPPLQSFVVVDLVVQLLDTSVDLGRQLQQTGISALGVVLELVGLVGSLSME